MPPTSIRTRCSGRRPVSIPSIASPGLPCNHRESGGKILAVRLLHRGLRRGDFRQDPQGAHRILRPQPGDRQRVRGGAAGLVPQRAHLFQPRRCRSAPSRCFATPCADRVSWGWARKSRCDSPSRRRPSCPSFRSRKSTKRPCIHDARERSPARDSGDRDRRVGRGRAGAVGIAARAAPEHAGGGIRRAASAARQAEPAGGGVFPQMRARRCARRRTRNRSRRGPSTSPRRTITCSSTPVRSSRCRRTSWSIIPGRPSTCCSNPPPKSTGSVCSASFSRARTRTAPRVLRPCTMPAD